MEYGSLRSMEGIRKSMATAPTHARSETERQKANAHTHPSLQVARTVLLPHSPVAGSGSMLSPTVHRVSEFGEGLAHGLRANSRQAPGNTFQSACDHCAQANHRAAPGLASAQYPALSPAFHAIPRCLRATWLFADLNRLEET